MTEQHVDHDDLVALALQEVEPEEQARLSAHLESCASCRAEYAGLEDTVSHTLAAAPAIAPPAGFSGRVLAEMGLAERPGSDSATAEGATQGRATQDRATQDRATQDNAEVATRRWRWLATAAAALVIGLGLGIGGTLAVTGPPAPAGSTAGAQTSAAALTTGSGASVGSAGTMVLSGRDYLVITVTKARPGATYECVVVGANGRRYSAGTWALEARDGTTEASGSWVVEAPATDLARVELIRPSGAVWARAEF